MEIVVVGNTAVIKSSFTVKQLKKIYKFDKSKLVLIEDDKPVFGFGFTTTPNGALSAVGAEFFAGQNYDENASITLMLAGDGDKRELIAEIFGTPLMRFAKLERTLHEVLAEIERTHNDIIGTIRVI